MTPEARTKIIEARKKQSKASDDDDKSVALVKSLTKTVKSLEKSNRKLKKLVSALQKCEEDDDTNSSLSSEGTSHFQKGVEILQNCSPKIVLALKSKKSKDLDLRNVLLLDNQLAFDLCCNKRFTSKIFGTSNPLIMTSNGGGLKITKKCRIPGYKYEVWFSKKAITNIICLKNLIKCYRAVSYTHLTLPTKA